MRIDGTVKVIRKVTTTDMACTYSNFNVPCKISQPSCLFRDRYLKVSHWFLKGVIQTVKLSIKMHFVCFLDCTSSWYAKNIETLSFKLISYILKDSQTTIPYKPARNLEIYLNYKMYHVIWSKSFEIFCIFVVLSVFSIVDYL